MTIAKTPDTWAAMVARAWVVWLTEEMEGGAMMKKILLWTEGKERPLLFSGEMIRAILDGRKSQTRRVIKARHNGVIAGPAAEPGTAIEAYGGGKRHIASRIIVLACPYGKPGDRLWVKETWALSTGSQNDHHSRVFYKDGESKLEYWQSGNHVPEKYGYLLSEKDRWRSSRYMPRWASRITLEVTGIRVEQAQDIDMLGVEREGTPNYNKRPSGADDTDFRFLWDSINKKRGYSWESNPWVWCVSFRRIET